MAELHAAVLDGAARAGRAQAELGLVDCQGGPRRQPCARRQPQAARDRVVRTPPRFCRPCAKRVVRAAEGR
eukprot:scaffold6580_cov60-Phaeocystis_antarctica.AAC.8